MISFNEFKEAIKNNLTAYLSADYSDYKVKINENVQKNNRILTGLALESPDTATMKISPQIYLEDFYEHYLEIDSLSECLADAAATLTRAYAQARSFKVLGNLSIPSKETILGNVIACVINPETNEELLESCPHSEFQDLAIIYRWAIDLSDSGHPCVMINNDLMNHLDISLEELHEAAMANTPKALSFKVMSIPEMMGLPVNESVPQMYAITNDIGFMGSSAILFPELIADMLPNNDTEMYILPSSIHDLIAVPASLMEPDDLARTVHEMNRSLSKSDILSDSVYSMDMQSHEICKMEGIYPDIDLDDMEL